MGNGIIELAGILRSVQLSLLVITVMVAVGSVVTVLMLALQSRMLRDHSSFLRDHSELLRDSQALLRETHQLAAKTAAALDNVARLVVHPGRPPGKRP